ncbi:MAG: F0F1 ATP synthase subunit B [Candidatus Gottesmanbacteria bacterium]|nr:F0F1 ATP synthase subunit B [Candidatus Gottesmanbacteria bacterium]
MEKLGIEPSLLLAQIVNFAIIVVVLTKLLYTPILAMIAKRKKEIEEGLALSVRQREEEEKFGIRKEKLLADARKEARVILEDGKKQAKEAEHEILAAAHKEASEILEKAKAEAIATHEALSADIRAEAVGLASAMAKRLVASVLSPGDQHKLIAKHLTELEKNKTL